MKSKALACVVLLLVMAFLLLQAIAPHTALADSTWLKAGMPSNNILSLSHDSGHNLLNAGAISQGVWDLSDLAAPTLSFITPSSGASGTTVEITNLAGTNLLTGATVKLSRSGQGEIAATGVTVESDTEITCAFDLAGAATGVWDVVVTNPDTQHGTLISGFTVTYPAPTVSSMTPSSGINNGPV